MRFSGFFFCLIIQAGIALGQVPQVPEIMYLGDQKLILNEKAREMIQKDVDALHSNRSYFEKKADKAALYFPIVEEVLQMEGIPSEFKYLAIQESGFQADAVSSSNAVGFWQFKAETAKEFGLTINEYADERMHIVYSTKGAARYLKKSYFFLQNWALSCQSYQMGLGGTQRSSDKKLFGQDEMKIDQKTYWYVMKFLAHVVAFRPYLERKSGQTRLLGLYKAKPHESIDNVLVNNGIDQEQFEELNVWLRKGRKNPFYKPYLMVVPKKQQVFVRKETKKETVTIETEFVEPTEFKKIQTDLPYDPSTRVIFVINGKRAILAEAGDSKITLAIRGGISKDKLVEYNDLRMRQEVVPGSAYYLEKKSKKSPVAFHVYRPEESLWEISQTYAMRLKDLKKKNHLNEGQMPLPGQVLWLKKKRPKGTQPAIMEIKIEEPEEVVNMIDEKPVELDTGLIARDSTENPKTETVKEVLESNEEKEQIEVEEPKKTLDHTVKKGETLYSISRAYGCSVEEIMKTNQLNGTALSIGQLIKIPVN